MKKMKKLLISLFALLSVTAHAEFSAGGEVLFRIINQQSETKGNSFFLRDFDDSSVFKFNASKTFDANYKFNFFLESKHQGSSDLVDQSAKLTLWKKVNDHVEAQVATELITDEETGALMLTEVQNTQDTYIKIFPMNDLTIHLRPFGSNLNIGDILRTQCMQKDTGGIDGDYKFNERLKFFYGLNTIGYYTDNTNMDNWDTDFDGTSVGLKFGSVIKVTPTIELVAEVGGNTAEDNDRVDTRDIKEGKYAGDIRVKFDNKKLLVQAEALLAKPNEAVTGTDQTSLAFGGKIQYSDFQFIPFANKSWLEVRHFKASDQNEMLFDLDNDDGNTDSAISEDYTKYFAVTELYWEGLTFTQELEVKHMKDAYKNNEGEIADYQARFTSLVKFYF